MGSQGIDYIDVIIVSFLWGTTNPFLRKGTMEEDEKQRLLEEEEQQQQRDQKQHQLGDDVGDGDDDDKYSSLINDDILSILSSDDRDDEEASAPLSQDIDSAYSYQATCVDGCKNSSSQITIGDKGKEKYIDKKSTGSLSLSLSSHSIPSKSSNQYSLYQEQAHIPTSYTKGILLQNLSRCCHCPNEALVTLSKFHPKALLKAFLSSLIYELTKFTKPKIAIPFMFNQSSAFFYYRLIATSDLTCVSYCHALSIAVEGVVSYMLGERMTNPWRGFGGAFIVMLGVGICLMSKEIESYFHLGADAGEGGVNGEDGGKRELVFGGGIGNYSFIETLWEQNSEQQSNVFEVSPFVCWYALCGIVQWFSMVFVQ